MEIIFWIGTLEKIIELGTAVAKFTSFLVPIIAIVIAWLGLNTWNRQTKGTDKYKVASETLLQTYRVREEIQTFRSPLIQYVPSNDKNESQEMNNYIGYVEALEKRWKQLLEPTAQLSLSSLKAEVHLGKEVKQAVDSLMRLVRELQIAFEMHIDMRRPNSGIKDDPFYRENSRTLWARPDDDKFQPKVLSAIFEIEKLTRPYL
jgi:hypothetical protein